MPQLEVSGLRYYPIKSCSGTEVEEMSLTELGPEFDREWMLVNERGTFITQRNRPEMATIKPRVDKAQGGILTVTAPGMEDLRVLPEEHGEERPVEFWKKAGTGISQGAEASDWFSTFFDRKVDLLRVRKPRPINPERRVEAGASSIGFADGFPLLLTSEASLDSLNRQLALPIPMDRFRPNIVIRDVSEEVEAYDEDYWRQIRIGSLGVFIVGACDRCPIPETDQETGSRENAKGPVTAALERTRHGVDAISGAAGNFFGQNAIHIFVPGTTIKVGDSVEVKDRAAERNIIF